jgi:probable DNA repair protein
LPAILTHALERGATVLTASAEQARAIHSGWGAMQRRQGRVSWPTPDVLSVHAWVMRSWSQVAAADDSGEIPHVLSPSQDQALWERVVLSSAEAQDFLQPFGAARAVRRSWQRVHDWAIALPSPREGGSDESVAFARWAQDYGRRLEKHRWLDEARAIWRLPTGSALDGTDIVFAGFGVPTPAQRRLGERLVARGAQVAWASPASERADAVRLGLPDPRSELEMAAQWSLSRLRAHPDARLLIIVPDLAQRREEVARLFSVVLMPAASLVETPLQTAPFAIEGGTGLKEHPLIVPALTALELASGAVPFEVASDWLRSPYLGGGLEAIARRARVDVSWRRVAQPEVSLREVIRALDGTPHAADAELALALQRFAESLQGPRATLSHWSGTFAAALHELGWPGTRALETAELEVLESFNDTLAELATLDAIAGPVRLAEAIKMLSGLAVARALPGATRQVPILISSRVADPCAHYDGVWIAGLHAAAWPRAPRPDPFIAYHLQRAAGVTEATADGALELARGITHSLLSSAPHVVVSWPLRLDDADTEPSPLLATLPDVRAADLIPAPTASYLQQVFRGAALETLSDEQAPAVRVPAKLRGGAKTLQLQSQCPFRAFAQRRLHAEPLERPLPGIDPRTRGTFIHRALESLWTLLGNRESLLLQSADERCALIAEAIAQARATIFKPAGRWPAQSVDLECRRLEGLLQRWLELESTRAPFEIVALEQKLQWVQAGLTFTLRIDRIDRLADGRTLLIDYKTGDAKASRWRGERPEEPQVPLYALALDTPPAALSFGLLTAEGCRFEGLSSPPPALPELQTIGEWPAQVAGWRAVLARLAGDFARGDARVDPLHATTCKRCHLHSLCRIEDVRAQAGEARADD